MYDAREIANYLLDYADRNNMPVTNMGLLKIIYYAHGWRLAKEDLPLVNNKFEAWEYGPVIRVIYDAFKQCEDEPIKNRATRFEVASNAYVVAQGNFDDNLQKFLMQIFDFYSRAHAYELSKMTHIENGPWHQIAEAAKTNVCLRMEIPNDIIKSHFDNAGTVLS